MNKVSKIEALLDAVARVNGAHNPESPCYRIKNPLLIKSFGRPGKHVVDEEGRRVFDSWLAGYKACLFDLDLKLRGKSRAGLKQDDVLENLLRVYGIREPGGISNVVSFIRRALDNQIVAKDTPLSFFIEVLPVLTPAGVD